MKRSSTVPRAQLSRYPASWLGVALRSGLRPVSRGLRFAPPPPSFDKICHWIEALSENGDSILLLRTQLRTHARRPRCKNPFYPN